MEYYVFFNAIEALFWIGLGAGVGIYGFRAAAEKKYKRLAIQAGVVFVIFGLTDVAEVFHGSFLEEGKEWLFVLKTACVLTLAYLLGRYMFLRLRK